MDWKTELSHASENMGKYQASQPDTIAGFSALHGAALKDGAVSTKNKELMALAIGISKQCIDCIAFHVEGAAKAGASRDEIMETIGVSIMMGGGPSFMYGVKAMEAYDQLVD